MSDDIKARAMQAASSMFTPCKRCGQTGHDKHGDRCEHCDDNCNTRSPGPHEVARTIEAFAADEVKQAVQAERDALVCEGLRQAQGVVKYLRTRANNTHPAALAILDDADIFLAANISRGGYDGTSSFDDGWSKP